MYKLSIRFVPGVLIFVLTVAVLLCLPSNTVAQTTTANIEGTVLDEKGNPAADVEVVARNEETGYYQIVITSATGKYRVNSLTPGSYMVRATHINYTMLTKKNVQLSVGQTALIDFSLTSKDIQQKEIVVEGVAPLIDTKKSDLSATVRSEQILAMPLNSRNFLELAAIAPGAKTSTGGRGPITTGALNSRFISAYIDGGEFKSDGLGGVLGTSFGFTTNIVPEDAIREFQVITSLYKAEYAKASNGIINAVTKSGGNEIHGTAFSFFRTQDFNALGVFEADTAKPNFNRQQYGLSIGGPIVKDQTHFFVSYERDNISNFLTVFNKGAQPALQGTFKSPTTQDLLLTRVTHQFSQDNSLDVRWLSVSTGNTPGNFGGNNAYSNGFNLKFTLNSVQATDRWLIDKNTINEFRVHYQHYIKDASAVSTDPNFFYQSSGINIGWNSVQPQIEDYTRFQIRDDISYVIPEMAGSHVFKAGVNFEYEPLKTKAEFTSGAVFTFRTDTSALPFQGAIGVGDAQTSTFNHKYGVYVQDDWTVLPNLTLNLGLRWDVETDMINNHYVNPLAGDTALTNHVPANYIGNGNRDINYGQIAPRLGFAWDLFNDRSTVVHGGFGVFFDRIIANVTNNEQQNAKYSTYTVTFGPTAPATTSRDVLRSYVQNNIGSTPAPGVTLLPSSVPVPYTNQWTVGVSREITPDLAASLDYVGIRGFNEYATINVNYQKGIGGPRVATPRYAGITLWVSDGQSWYDGIQLSLRRPYRGDWQMQVSYTLSSAYNTFDDPFSGPVFRQDIVKAYSQQDERHRFAISGIVNLPYDFQLSGVATVASPRPITATTGTDDNGAGALGDDYPGGPSGRNSIRPDPNAITYWFKNVDIRITKFVDLLGVGRIGLIAEAFNLFNWTNYTSYLSRQNQVVSGVSVFQQPNTASATRQIQFGARVTF